MEGFHRNYRYRKHTDCTQKKKAECHFLHHVKKKKHSIFSIRTLAQASAALRLARRSAAERAASHALAQALHAAAPAAARPAHRAASRLSSAHPPAAGRLHAPRAQQLQAARQYRDLQLFWGGPSAMPNWAMPMSMMMHWSSIVSVASVSVGAAARCAI